MPRGSATFVRCTHRDTCSSSPARSGPAAFRARAWRPSHRLQRLLRRRRLPRSPARPVHGPSRGRYRDRSQRWQRPRQRPMPQSRAHAQRCEDRIRRFHMQLARREFGQVLVLGHRSHRRPSRRFAILQLSQDSTLAQLLRLRTCNFARPRTFVRSIARREGCSRQGHSSARCSLR